MCAHACKVCAGLGLQEEGAEWRGATLTLKERRVPLRTILILATFQALPRVKKLKSDEDWWFGNSHKSV